jgi:two-component system phosphate regulon response regulator OmpR
LAKICKLLLVEDQRDMQDLLHELFSSEGYRFIIVGDGAAMRRALDSDPDIDAAVIDVLLPGDTDGMTLANEVAARGLPVIVVTGDHTQADKLESSGHRFLLKPFKLAGFIALIDEMLRTTEAQCERDIYGASLYAFAAEKHGAVAFEDSDNIVTVELPLAGEAAPGGA